MDKNNIGFRQYKLSNIEENEDVIINEDNTITIVAPEGYYIKDFEIQSEKVKGGEDNGD